MRSVIQRYAYNWHQRLVWLVPVNVLLVVLAGGIVRATGSGMGCPDWPKCFGMWIPPTSVDQLPSDYLTRFTQQGQVVEVFNPIKTWVEYLNRLLGALLGVLLLVHFFASLLRANRNYLHVLFAFLLLGLTAFQAWIGALTVYSNLAVGKISVHMIIAIAILLLAVLNLFLVSNKFRQQTALPERRLSSIPLRLRYLSLVVFLLTIIQVVLGVSVREHVDTMLLSTDRSSVSSNLGLNFYVHRSFSLIVLASSLIVLKSTYSFYSGYLRFFAKCNLLFVMSLLALGIILFYFNFPAWAQPLHLFFSFLLLSTQFAFIILLFNRNSAPLALEPKVTLSNG